MKSFNHMREQSSFLAPSFRAAIEVPAGTVQSPSADFLYSFGRPVLSGVSVTPDTAIAVTIVYACVNNISQDIGKLPIHLKRRLPGSIGKMDDPVHPVWRVLHDLPNRWQTPYEFKQMMQGHLLLRGNAYARQIRDGSGRLRELIPFHPDQVTLRITPQGALFYDFKMLDGTRITLPQSEVFHLRALSARGYVGMSPISAAAEAIGLALAAEMHDASLLGRGATPMGVLKFEKNLTLEQKEGARATWDAIHAGPRNSGRVAVLEGGLDWKDIGLSPKDLELLGLREFQGPEVARVFRVPLHKVGIMKQATNNNIEQQAREYVDDCLSSWFVCWEQAIFRDLLLPEEQVNYFAKFNPDAMLRADTISRYKAHQLACGGPFVTRNEVRCIEDLNPDPDPKMDEILLPLNIGVGADGGDEAAVLDGKLENAAAN